MSPSRWSYPMTRYLVTFTIWLVLGLAILLGRGPDPRPGYVSDFSTVFGVGLIEPWLYWCVVGATFALALGFGILWFRSRPLRVNPLATPRGFEVVTRSDGGRGAT